ncbi:ATP-binding protein [Reyranella sp.]|jgi:serine/threonine-protein kinase RsbT|uniref:ATP-binding protein n=1 Tax=Reyranella sp. TaxID=1929291 RepID=UPI000BDB8DB9|nr:ATP-binding protein [Reyranella sp.]OYW97675.1 MAG: anti-sigma regulatory factor [Rhizobiales bacterium 32-66-8]OYY42726.1 MAG: anti-sigma regulatory factor [Rhodospirillales bacterium 35-66-84]OYZ94325.1 MAG: anti-sigma regulatory factor [Rhodospirillales bacterium 24-66-33]OZB25247.1 MAG: anti-sigma regulatory factor [Rhodospirillales bacterium 39-66-50]HQS16571.1 ATP-binding protein [Reyranella sp.]
MPTTTDTLPITSGDDVVRVRQKVRVRATEIGLSLVDQTKLITAASELARNTLDYGKGGHADIETVLGDRRGVRVIFRDRGPGIPDIPQALTDGFTSGNGLGHGLGGARRLVDDFDIQSIVGAGTTVTIARWKR